jgi:HD superfamily phosphohydrolase
MLYKAIKTNDSTFDITEQKEALNVSKNDIKIVSNNLLSKLSYVTYLVNSYNKTGLKRYRKELFNYMQKNGINKLSDYRYSVSKMVFELYKDRYLNGQESTLLKYKIIDNSENNATFVENKPNN